jgi:hypothetical protein
MHMGLAMEPGSVLPVSPSHMVAGLATTLQSALLLFGMKGRPGQNRRAGQY